GHRLEGHRLKTGGQTFKKMVDEQILPKEFQVYSDPTLRSYAGTDMNGSYLYDDEGIKARRVNNVVNGVLKEFLMSRIPIDGFPVSNGHGRTSGAHDPVSRQSNFIVETTKPYTDIELRKMLIEEAKKQGKSYGYYYKSVTSGFTFTGENGSLNSFNVKPLEVYRVFTDGRPDELVRGVDLIGTPLAMFSNIVAAGDKASVFTGSCGAESGWVPVTASSPDIFVSQIETQRRQQSRDIPPILPAPEFKDTVITGIDDVILGAMRDELKRNQENLILPGAPRPFYLSFLASRYRQFQIIAKLGGIHSSVFTPWRMAGTTQVLVGDFKRNSELQPGESINTPLPSDADYSGIRRNYWGASDVAYKYALNNYSQKIAYLKANPLPNEMEKLPEMQRLAPVTKIEQSKRPYTIDQAKLEQTAAELSAIFLDYKYLTNTSVEISGAETENYRYTSENVQLKQPQGNIRIKVTAAVRVNDGSNVMDVYEVVGANPADLPPLNALKEKVTALADNLMKQKEAPIVEDYYSGPIMLEDDATASILIENLLGRDGLVAKHSLSSGGKSIADKLEKKILDPRITIKNYSDLPEYNGVSLMGCYTTDADGITPAKELTLVDKGILRQLLNDRYPALKAPKSTGSQRFTNQAGSVSLLPSIGTLHIQAESGIDRNKMKEALLQAAKKEKLDFSYIIRCPQGCTSLQVYKVDVKSGEETLVRTSNLTLPTLEKLTDLVAISSEENVKNRDNNCNTSVIYPAVIIVREMEIGRPNIKSSKAPALPYPLQRRN
ncbi:MAG TPA: hypothetical protein DEF88_04360, partial [Porphyromonadaceae bacterium]|nr:hypothetical protein [Porphyromonadaceae bacterium]